MLQLMLRPPLAKPMPMMAPMTACELETGTSGSAGSPFYNRTRSRFSEANMYQTSDCETTTIQATIGDMRIRPLPMVLIILCE